MPRQSSLSYSKKYFLKVIMWAMVLNYVTLKFSTYSENWHVYRKIQTWTQCSGPIWHKDGGHWPAISLIEKLCHVFLGAAEHSLGCTFLFHFLLEFSNKNEREMFPLSLGCKQVHKPSTVQGKWWEGECMEACRRSFADQKSANAADGHLETKSNVWSPPSIFLIVVSVMMYIHFLYIAYCESQADLKHRCK